MTLSPGKGKRAAVPFCNHCDRKLYAGGASYVEVQHKEFGPMKAHRICADEMRRAGELDEAP